MYTQPVPQLHARDMYVVENVQPQSLPDQIDDGYTKGALKYSQLGADAWHELMLALFDGVTLNTRNAVHVVDIGMLWPESFTAFQRMQQSHKTPFFFQGLMPDVNHSEWLEEAILNKTAQQLQLKSLTLPGYSWRDLTPPAEHLEDSPAQPQLKRLVWEKSGEGMAPNIRVPDDIKKAWYHHSEFGADFRAFLDAHDAEFPSATYSKGVEESPTKKPRMETTPTKKHKLDGV